MSVAENIGILQTDSLTDGESEQTNKLTQQVKGKDLVSTITYCDS